MNEDMYQLTKALHGIHHKEKMQIHHRQYKEQTQTHRNETVVQ